jgi:predicted amidohydrolase
VFAPTGRVIAEACAWNDELLFADLDGDLLAQYRAMPCYALKSRRPDAYSELTRDAGHDRRD